MTKQVSQNAAGQREFPRRQDDRTSPPDFRDLSQEFAPANGQIVFRHAVTPSDQKCVLIGGVRAYDAVNKKTAPAHVQHNFTPLHVLRLVGVNREKIPGPQCGKHADTRRPQLQNPRRSKHIGRKTALFFVACLDTNFRTYNSPRHWQRVTSARFSPLYKLTLTHYVIRRKHNVRHYCVRGYPPNMTRGQGFTTRSARASKPDAAEKEKEPARQRRKPGPEFLHDYDSVGDRNSSGLKTESRQQRSSLNDRRLTIIA